jgi:hypothetical protein
MVPREKAGGGLNYPTQIPEEGVHALDRMTGELQGEIPPAMWYRVGTDVKGWNSTNHIRSQMASEPLKSREPEKRVFVRDSTVSIRAVECCAF